ncbi:hypothetical protein E2C01_043680 [Portunus trituberculatus]|uniref:Uncharacterized protein n=1 Tax=Portunus trituberculatus TaxID=210409 RepID=A0A5B7FX08_PORTR|nr:hypothetical protein [Portunus trituberculatus]
MSSALTINHSASSKVVRVVVVVVVLRAFEYQRLSIHLILPYIHFCDSEWIGCRWMCVQVPGQAAHDSSFLE